MDGVAKFLPCVSGRIFITKYSPQLSFKTENHFFLKKLLYLFYYWYFCFLCLQGSWAKSPKKQSVGAYL